MFAAMIACSIEVNFYLAHLICMDPLLAGIVESAVATKIWATEA